MRQEALALQGRCGKCGRKHWHCKGGVEKCGRKHWHCKGGVGNEAGNIGTAQGELLLMMVYFCYAQNVREFMRVLYRAQGCFKATHATHATQGSRISQFMCVLYRGSRML
eukprot:1159744-Pelagomonas_calceolata.AAC.6